MSSYFYASYYDIGDQVSRSSIIGCRKSIVPPWYTNKLAPICDMTYLSKVRFNSIIAQVGAILSQINPPPKKKNCLSITLDSQSLWNSSTNSSGY